MPFFVGMQGLRYPGNLSGQTPELTFTLPEGQRITLRVLTPRPDSSISFRVLVLELRQFFDFSENLAICRFFIMLPLPALFKRQDIPLSRYAPCACRIQKKAPRLREGHPQISCCCQLFYDTAGNPASATPEFFRNVGVVISPCMDHE